MPNPSDVIHKALETMFARFLYDFGGSSFFTETQPKDPFNLLSSQSPQGAADIGWFPEIDAGAALWGLGCSPGAVVAVARMQWFTIYTIGFVKSYTGTPKVLELMVLLAESLDAAVMLTC